eukprot:4507806-Amphidinium_carterae.1
MGFVATAAFSAILAESFFLAVMRESRVAGNAPALMEQLLMGWDYWDHMDPFIPDAGANMVRIEPIEPFRQREDYPGACVPEIFMRISLRYNTCR